MAVRILLGLMVFLWAGAAGSQPSFDVVTLTTSPEGDQTYSVTLQVLILMTVLGLLPSALIMLTAFTRIIIVLALLRQGMGTASTPSNQVLIGLALFLTFFVMTPVFDQVHEVALAPLLSGELAAEEAVILASKPIREFMMAQTRESDLAMYARIRGDSGFETPDDVPFTLLVPAFVTSELKTAFQIGFLILIPFLIIDIVVASVLMSMGMMMLSPMIISLPFKVMLFVLVDGWALIMGTLAASFYV